MKHAVLGLVGVSALWYSSALMASQSISSIAASAAIHAESQATAQGFAGVEVDIRPLDSRISLNPCNTPLSVASASDRVLGAVSIAVSCSSPAPWTFT